MAGGLTGLIGRIGLPKGAELSAALHALSNDAAGYRRLAGRAIGAIGRNPAVGYEIAMRLGPGDPIADRAAAALRDAHGLKALFWQGRLARERGDHATAFTAFAEVIDGPDADLARQALFDAAKLGLRLDHYVRRWPVIEAAIDAGLSPTPAWRLEAVRDIMSRTGPVADPPTIAFHDLIDNVLPSVTPYQPENTLLLVGNTLGCGGMERILANSFRALKASARQGAGPFDSVHLGLMRFDPDGATGFYAGEADIVPGDVTVLRSDAAPHPAIATLPYGWIPRAQAVHDLVRTQLPRVVHAWNDLTGMIAAFAALAAGAPRVIVHFHHMRPVADQPDAFAQTHYPACYRLLAGLPQVEFLFCAEAAMADYADWWDVTPSPRWRTLHNGFFVDPVAQPRDIGSAKAALGLDPARPVVGSVFRFDAVKQPLLWADAAIAIHARRPDVQFLLVGGGGTLRDEVADRLRRAGIDAQLPGQVRDVPRWLAAMDQFMMTSRTEGLPNGAVEAQFAGVPLIAFDVGGTRETILPGETGWLAPPDDVAALAGLALERLDDPAALALAGAAASAQAVDRFAMSRYLSRLQDCYGSPR